MFRNQFKTLYLNMEMSYWNQRKFYYLLQYDVACLGYIYTQCEVTFPKNVKRSKFMHEIVKRKLVIADKVLKNILEQIFEPINPSE